MAYPWAHEYICHGRSIKIVLPPIVYQLPIGLQLNSIRKSDSKLHFLMFSLFPIESMNVQAFQRRICSCKSTAIFWSETSSPNTCGSFSIPCHCDNDTFSQQISVSWSIFTINNHGHTSWLFTIIFSPGEGCFHARSCWRR